MVVSHANPMPDTILQFTCRVRRRPTPTPTTDDATICEVLTGAPITDDARITPAELA